MNRKVPAAFLALALLCAGCSQSPYMKGKTASQTGDYETAIRELYIAVGEHPDDHKAWSEIGLAYYRQDMLEKAEEALSMSNKIEPTALSNFYLGLIFERGNRLDLAIRSYGAAVNLEGDKKTKQMLKERLNVLIDGKLRQDASLAVKNESGIDASTLPENSIAVINFDGSALPSELGSLALGMAEFTAMDLAKIRSLKVVERVKINVILDELKLSQSNYADPSMAPRVGKLVGSRQLVLGAVTSTGDESFRIDGALVNSLDSGVSRTEPAEGETGRFFDVQKKFVFDLIDTLGIELTKEERDAIEEVPTEDFLAFMAFSEGLYYQKRGMYDEALSSFNNAAEHDPGFSEAAGMAGMMSSAISCSGEGGGIQAFETSVGGSIGDEGGEVGLGSVQAGNLLNGGFIFDNNLYWNFGSGAVDPPWGGPIWSGSGIVVIEGNFNAD